MRRISPALRCRVNEIDMKLHQDPTGGGLVIDGYGPGYVMVSGERREKSFLLATGGTVDVALPAASDIAGPSDAALEAIAALSPAPEVFLLGAGEHSPDRRMEWLAPFAARGASLEIMSLPAACRTYNILHADGRAVAAILLL